MDGPRHTLADLTLRPARPDDAPAFATMHARCSMESIFRRYLCAVPAVSPVLQAELLASPVALVAVDGRGLHALGTVAGPPGGDTGEVALLIEDRYQGHGLGTRMARRLAQSARAEGYRHLTADVLASSYGAQRVLTSLGRASVREHDGLVTYTVRLAPVRAVA